MDPDPTKFKKKMVGMDRLPRKVGSGSSHLQKLNVSVLHRFGLTVPVKLIHSITSTQELRYANLLIGSKTFSYEGSLITPFLQVLVIICAPNER